MKFVNWRKSLSSSLSNDYRLIRVLLFSTKTLISQPSPSLSLLKRVSRINDPRASIVPVLEKWIDEGKSIQKEELQSLIGTMRKFKRFRHALEVSQWMSDRRYFDLTSSDVNIRLKLIYSVHGLEHAENYFNNIWKHSKVAQTYGVLLECYVNEKSVDKAEAIMKEMKSTGLEISSFPYNRLIDLYAQTGQQEKIDTLLAEMEVKGIPQDKYTLTNRLIGYITVSDIEGMENILNLLEDPSFCVDWSAYAVAARGYLKIGLIDKVLEMLKKVEEMTMKNRTNKIVDYLLTLYASAGKKDDVYRIWNSYESARKVKNSSYSRPASYSCMISSLEKLDDIEGAEKIWEEWESKGFNNDFRVLNQLVSGYCKRRLFEKADMLVQKAMQEVAESGRSPYASAWNILAMGYLSDKQMLQGVEMLKKALLVGRQGWKPSPVSVTSCLEYFEVERDVKGADEFVELLGASGLLTKEIYHWLLRIYIAADKPVSDVLDLMKADGLPADEETHKILQGRPEQKDQTV